MDAARLVAQAERALDIDPRPEAVIAEAWQAYELTEAVARLLDERDIDDAAVEGEPDPPEGPAGRHRGRRLTAGPRSLLSAAGSGPPRAARLTTVRDPDGTLRALRVLLGAIGLAVVGLIGSACDEQAYWSCVEALDAVDEAKDLITGLARADTG